MSHYRYILIGDSKVGKSSLLLQYTERQFVHDQEITLGAEMNSRICHIDGKEIKLEIWDTAGQESYLALTRSYYRNTDGCLLVFDITRASTFKALPMWLSEARQNSNNPNIVILMIGNKADLSDQRQVSTAEAEEFAIANNIIYTELSAKNYQQVEEAFLQSAEEITKTINEHGRAKQSGIYLKSSYSKSGESICC
jgi:small GTP-binding protein